MSPAVVYAIRLKPKQDLKRELLNFCHSHGLQAASLLTCVGSLENARLRLANASESKNFQGPFEIVSLTGTLGPDGAHLHISIADKNGGVLGGHLLDGSLIFTTAEVTLIEATKLIFGREIDPQTNYKEITIKERSSFDTKK